MTRSRWGCLGLLSWMAVCGCGPPEQPPANESHPQRIVSLAPNLTEIIFLLGGQDRLVGVSPYCKFPPEAAAKPKVGALVNMDYEALRALDPDLVVMLPGQSETAQKIEQLGIRAAIFRSETIEDIHNMILGLGEILGEKERAGIEVARLKAGFETLKAESAARAGQRRARVLLVIGRNPGTLQQIYACGSGNFLNSLIEAAGAENVMGQTTTPWPVINKEAVVQYDPDVILDASLFQGEVPQADSAHMKAWEQLGMLKAVREGRVVSLEEDHLLVVGPWFVEGARLLTEAIYGKTPQ